MWQDYIIVFYNCNTFIVNKQILTLSDLNLKTMRKCVEWPKEIFLGSFSTFFVIDF
jgi:hypothetical protein